MKKPIAVHDRIKMFKAESGGRMGHGRQIINSVAQLAGTIKASRRKVAKITSNASVGFHVYLKRQVQSRAAVFKRQKTTPPGKTERRLKQPGRGVRVFCGRQAR
ncbi:hypothetical protein HMP0721_1372 [Pseudoramibacter alactolyticus ATCC 23263]|uniref:Uncharacterized protein n=1 Tax=Pseudoramibacter alactolyticus ATCC 23263 TaxID=887929 RepID=E6MH87_9FIRM|nr:hypothetical protein HMP0721_1372 [Pseudoramibacter alactolyticus ATCC 23263]